MCDARPNMGQKHPKINSYPRFSSSSDNEHEAIAENWSALLEELESIQKRKRAPEIKGTFSLTNFYLNTYIMGFSF